MIYDKNRILLNITDRKDITKVEIYYVDNKEKILKISKKISFNKYYRSRWIIDKEINNFSKDIIEKIEKIIIKICLFSHILLLVEIPKYLFSSEGVFFYAIKSKFIYKLFEEVGGKNTFEYIESYKPLDYEENFQVDCVLGEVRYEKNMFFISVDKMPKNNEFLKYIDENTTFIEYYKLDYKYKMKSNQSIN